MNSLPAVIRPTEHAVYHEDKMGKCTLFESPRLLVGLNAFEPGQRHELHTHTAMDKVYLVLSGSGFYLLEGQELPVREGDMMTAPAEAPHGIRNPGPGRLLILAALAPAPAKKG